MVTEFGIMEVAPESRDMRTADIMIISETKEDPVKVCINSHVATTQEDVVTLITGAFFHAGLRIVTVLLVLDRKIAVYVSNSLTYLKSEIAEQ